VELVKIFLGLGMQIKHIKNLPPINFSFGDKEVNATIDKMEGGMMIRSLITSNEPIYVSHFYSIFEQLWNKGIDAQDRICNVEEGRADETNIEIIPNPKRGIEHATKSHVGTGLGLFISKSIVEAHGGRMWAENNLVGKGATFCFSVPIAP
jgi:hypothetical protein